MLLSTNFSKLCLPGGANFFSFSLIPWYLPLLNMAPIDYRNTIGNMPQKWKYYGIWSMPNRACGVLACFAQLGGRWRLNMRQPMMNRGY